MSRIFFHLFLALCRPSPPKRREKTHPPHTILRFLLRSLFSQTPTSKNSPARRGGPQVVVALPRLRGLHRAFCGCLRGLLLLRPERHGGVDAVFVLLRVHRSLLLGVEPDAGLRRVEEQPGVRSRDVQGDQERVKERVERREKGEEEVFFSFVSFVCGSAARERVKELSSLSSLLPRLLFPLQS